MIVTWKSPAACVEPAIVAVPSPLSVKVTPCGSAPLVIASVGIGNPLVVTVNVPAVLFVNVVLFGLVIAAPAPIDTFGSALPNGSAVVYAASENAVVVHTSFTAALLIVSLAVVVN